MSFHQVGYAFTASPKTENAIVNLGEVQLVRFGGLIILLPRSARAHIHR
jgi:hypothetical protein